MDAWKFGDIEIHLSQGKVDFIWCDTISWLVDEAIHLGEVFDLDPWFLHKDVLLDEAEKCLRASHLHYRIRPIKQELGAVIKFESKTQIIFIEDEITGMRLNAFGTDLHPCSS